MFWPISVLPVKPVIAPAFVDVQPRRSGRRTRDRPGRRGPTPAPQHRRRDATTSRPPPSAGENAHEVAPLQIEAVAWRFEARSAPARIVRHAFAPHRAGPSARPTRASSACVRAASLIGLHDPRIGAAPADVAVHDARDVLFGGIAGGAKQGDRGHDHAGRAVAALERFGLEEGFLDRMQPLAVGDPFDGRDRLPGDSRQTRVHERVAWPSDETVHAPQ